MEMDSEPASQLHTARAAARVSLPAAHLMPHRLKGMETPETSPRSELGSPGNITNRRGQKVPRLRAVPLLCRYLHSTKVSRR